MKKQEYLELGIIQTQEGKNKRALKSLRRALNLYTGHEESLEGLKNKDFQNLPSELFSYYGLCITLVENRGQAGVHLCKVALSRDVLRPDFYLNLGKVYLFSGKKVLALKTFQKGLEIFGVEGSIIKEWKKLGIRKKPPLKFLPRGHFVNRYLGRTLRKKAS